MTLEELTKLAYEYKKEKHPLVPEYALPKPNKFKDTTANELTKAIVTYIRLTGNYCDRINNMGVYDKKIKGYRKANTRKGICDIMASKKVKIQDREIAINVGIEVKIGKDKLSIHQQKMQEEITKTGGVYIIATNWDTFYNQWIQIT